MLGALFNLILIAVGLAMCVVWIYSLATWDGKGCEPDKDCRHCPFPCEHNKNTEDYEK